MELLGGLALLGKYISDKYTTKNKDNNNSKTYKKQIKKYKTTGNNIYSSHEIKKNQDIIEQIMSNRYTQADEPNKTGIIPNYYNEYHNQVNVPLDELNNDNDSTFSDIKSIELQDPLYNNKK